MAGLYPEVLPGGTVGKYSEQEASSKVEQMEVDLLNDKTAPDARPGSSTKNVATYQDPNLPIFTDQALKQFEAVFLTDSQLAQCKELFSSKVQESTNPFYTAWLAFTKASLPTEEKALDMVVGRNTPKEHTK